MGGIPLVVANGLPREVEKLVIPTRKICSACTEFDTLEQPNTNTHDSAACAITLIKERLYLIDCDLYDAVDTATTNKDRAHIVNRDTELPVVLGPRFEPLKTLSKLPLIAEAVEEFV